MQFLERHYQTFVNTAEHTIVSSLPFKAILKLVAWSLTLKMQIPTNFRYFKISTGFWKNHTTRVDSPIYSI